MWCGGLFPYGFWKLFDDCLWLFMRFHRWFCRLPTDHVSGLDFSKESLQRPLGMMETAFGTSLFDICLFFLFEKNKWTVRAPQIFLWKQARGIWPIGLLWRLFRLFGGILESISINSNAQSNKQKKGGNSFMISYFIWE
jgi:hypothetical protein